jgi:hypothetical protein
MAGFREANPQAATPVCPISRGERERVSSLFRLAAECPGRPTAVRTFLHSEHAELGGRTPLEAAAQSSDGLEHVLSLLSQVHRQHLPRSTRA